MSLIEHWWLVMLPNGAPYAVRPTRDSAEQYARNLGDGYGVVEVEPSATTRGAVGALDALQWMPQDGYNEHSPVIVERESFERLRRAIRGG